ncbi:hypothetical protein OEA41_009851 [Lepraria neglecta]|uniref:Uncharacterized protein n=1 Tax=Lepraria neglecta TaxID=209136 RepID=A0AAD9YVD6_9LECA|nr:hypothetical protein OEA41_009851 [Lepraria neglecta]
MLVDMGQAVGSGRIRGPRGAKDKEVITVLRRIRGSLKKLQESYESGARNQGPARILANPVSAGDPRSMPFQHSNSVIAHLCRFMENATLFTQLREWGRSQITDAVYRRLKLMHEYVRQVVQHGKIQVHGNDDKVAMSITQRLVQDYEAKENISPSSSVKKSGPPEDTEPNPLLTYLSRVMDFGDPLSILKNLEQSPMSNLTMRNLKVITDHIERGIESGELSKGPAQGGKDAYAEAIIKHLKGAATPLQAWANSSNAPERPKKDESRSGSTHQNPDHGQRPRITIALKVIARNVSRELFARYRKRQYDMDLGKALRSGVSQARVPTNSQSLLTPAHSRSGSRQEAQVNQISGTSDDQKNDADENEFGAPLTGQGTSGLRTQGHVDSSNTPPPTPRPKPKKLLISTKAVAPPKAQIDATSKEWANMTPGAALENAQNLALQQQIHFYSILDQ